jgi:hypothetical protein
MPASTSRRRLVPAASKPKNAASFSSIDGAPLAVRARGLSRGGRVSITRDANFHQRWRRNRDGVKIAVRREIRDAKIQARSQIE